MRLCVVALCLVALGSGCAREATRSETTNATSVRRMTATPRAAATVAMLVSRRAPATVPTTTPVTLRTRAPSTPPPAFAPFGTLPFPVASPTVATVQPFTVPQIPQELLTAPPTPSVPFTNPDDPPQIIDVMLPTDAVSAGEVITGDVVASSNVASVELRIGQFAESMEKIAPGRFSVTLRVPSLPFFLRHRSYAISIVARNTRGDAVVQNVSVYVR